MGLSLLMDGAVGIAVSVMNGGWLVEGLCDLCSNEAVCDVEEFFGRLLYDAME